MKLSDEKLLLKVKELRQVERRTLGDILTHLQEIHDRRLYADLGYSSLFKYLTKELGYSEGAAYRRQKAMELSKRLPETKWLMVKGELNLTVAASLQNFSKNMDLKKTKSVLSKVKNKTKDEAKIEFQKMTPGFSAVKHDKKESISETESRIHVNLSNRTLFKLEKLKAIKKLTTNQALDYLLDLGFEEYENSLSVRKRTRGTKGRNIPAGLSKEVFQRANSACEFPACGDFHSLEVEHVKPWALGGTHELSNLKLYCKTHNQRAAIKMFGKEKILQYFQ